MSDYVSKARELVKAHKYFQFSASWCPDCVYANSIWEKYNITSKIFIFDISTESKDKAEESVWRSAFKEATGSRNLPTIYIDGQIWGTESKLHQLENAGLLEEEFKKLNLL
ncbi:glutathione-disulfide reductase GRX8 Ecym_2757 [Eremothecium cymbalariae DBVPG|uniref:Glutaredoxin domain-containing protein n=1 Tax=Eremothecium cymbalariae (strain CBS 270.75 / DBVPG 7215 / KCTC 17166 / NRRL Y-17582) TaxID=931890 RepID=G8JPZ3_ERECY|nr:Hypothetical protein Ecym_2757 [Eremothecium cymbalariae DBVPG\